MTSTSIMHRLYFLAASLQSEGTVVLPPDNLMSFLGKGWNKILRAGAEHGLSGSLAALPTVDFEQLSMFYETGAEMGPSPTMDEFRATLFNQIYSKLCGNETMSAFDQAKLISALYKWSQGMDTANGNGVLDFDAEVETPMFTKSGFVPFDYICGKHGIPQEVVTVMSQPGVGKTTWLMATAFAWRRQKIGPVTFIQTELSPAAMAMKRDGMYRTGERGNLFVPGEDKMVFGRYQAYQELEAAIKEPHPDRLIVVDSLSGWCGSGDSPESRQRYSDVYDLLMQAKNASRFCLCATHVKRGQDVIGIESAAAAAANERFTGVMITLEKDEGIRPDGLSEIWVGSVKNRYHQIPRPKKFAVNYVTGDVIDTDSEQELFNEMYGSAGEELS